MAKIPSSRFQARSERIEFYVTPTQVAQLDMARRRANMTRSEFLREELATVLGGGTSVLQQVRLFVLQLEHENALARAEGVAAEIEHTRSLIEARRGTLLAGEIPSLEKRLDTLRAMHAKSGDRVEKLERQIAALRAAPRGMAAMIALPFVVGISAGGILALTALFVILVGASLFGVGWWWRNRHQVGRASARLQHLRMALRPPPHPSEEERLAEEVLDKGVSMSPQEILARHWIDPPTLRHRLRCMLDEENGLEKLRVAIEDGRFEHIESSGKVLRVHVVAVTDDQWALLPAEFQLQALSERTRGTLPPSMLRTMREREPAREAAKEALAERAPPPAEGSAAAATPAELPKRGRGRPSKAEIAARQAREAPGILPHQPRPEDRSERASPRGGPAPSGGGAQ